MPPVPFRRQRLPASGSVGLTNAIETNLDSIGKALDSLADVVMTPMAATQVITYRFVSGSGNHVPHSLGRAWSHWSLMERDADVRIWTAFNQTDRARFVSLAATATCSGTIMVF